VPALRFDRADGRRRDQTAEDTRGAMVTPVADGNGNETFGDVRREVITRSWSWASAPAVSRPPGNSSGTLPSRQRRKAYAQKDIR